MPSNYVMACDVYTIFGVRRIYKEFDTFNDSCNYFYKTLLKDNNIVFVGLYQLYKEF